MNNTTVRHRFAQPGSGDDNNRPSGQNSRQRENLKPHSRLAITFLQIVSGVLVLMYFLVPAFIKIYPPIISDVAFLNHLRWPPFIDLNNPDSFGLNKTRNFHLGTDNDVTVGVWHMLPSDLLAKAPSNMNDYPSLLSEGSPIVLYLHGNAGTRAAWHRVQLYKVLTSAGYHVVTFDYRGYGDSTGFPTEDGLVHDSVSIFNWIKKHSGSARVYIWGHSLGSAVATKTAKVLSEKGADFKGLILESPFNNFIEAASNHPFSAPFRVLPWFTWCFIQGIKDNNIRFSSDENIGGVAVPTIILHATDDGVVPYSLGRKLYEAALKTKEVGSIEFVTFDGEKGYGHKHIHKDPGLIDIVKKFTDSHK